MAKNLNNITKPPVTVEEAVERLMVILDDDEKERIKLIPKDDLIDLHFNLGKDIRNAFGLYDDNTVLMADCEAIGPDDCSMRIIQRLWDQLNED